MNDQKIIALGDIVVTVVRGPKEVPVSRTFPQTIYKELRPMILELRPGHRSLDLHLPTRKIAKTIRSSLNNWSCIPRNSHAKTLSSYYRLPWPYKTIHTWIPESSHELDGKGILRVWVVSRI